MTQRIAKVSSINAGRTNIAAGVKTPIWWGVREFDSDPYAGLYTSGIVVVDTATGVPRSDGLFYIRDVGVYRFCCQIYYAAWEKVNLNRTDHKNVSDIYDTGNGASIYLTLDELGNLDAGSPSENGARGVMMVGNTQAEFGRHPSLAIDTIIQVMTPGCYYQFNTYYYPVPQELGFPTSHNLQPEGYYNSAYIERLG